MTKLLKGLSVRAKTLLAVIREHCDPTNPDPNLRSFFVPSAYPVWCEMFPHESVDIHGSGDANVIKSIIRRGWATQKNLAAYSCMITEDGILAYEELRNDPDALSSQDKKKAEQSRLKAEMDADPDSIYGHSRFEDI